jgi:hypothetical protein
MTRAQAIKEAQRRWGERGAVCYDRRCCSAEERAAASAQLAEHLAAKPAPMTREWDRERQRLLARTHSSRYMVGVVSFAFCIEGRGDSWAEAFEEVDMRAERRCAWDREHAHA